MRKQARRLWFGDWRRDEELPQTRAANPTDTVLITPEDEPEAEPAERRPDARRAVATAAAAAFLAVLAFAVFSGGDDKAVVSDEPQTPPSQTPLPQAQPQVPQTQVPQGAPQGGFGGPDLTGDAATKAAQAALQKYPGDIERVTRGPTGDGYVVHVIQPDGNEVHVLVDDQFKVQGSDANRGPRSFGPSTSQ